MPSVELPRRTLIPFPALALAIAVFPVLLAERWEKTLVSSAGDRLCTLPVALYELGCGHPELLAHGTQSYLTFILTLGALFVTSGASR